MRQDRRTAKFRKRRIDWTDSVQVAAYHKKYQEGYNRKNAVKKTPHNKLVYWREYRAANKEEVASYQKAYRQKHKKYLVASKRMWRRLHPAETNAANRKWRINNPHKVAAQRLRNKYGLTVEQYVSLGTHCHICGVETKAGKRQGKRTRCIDHNHRSGAVRGILCSQCNWGIGLFSDSPEALRRAANYLDTHEARQRDKAS